MTTEERKTLEFLKTAKYDYVYRNEKEQLIGFREKDQKKILLDCTCFQTITEPCPIYQLEQLAKHNINKDVLTTWLWFLENGRVETVINILKEKIK